LVEPGLPGDNWNVLCLPDLSHLTPEPSGLLLVPSREEQLNRVHLSSPHVHRGLSFLIVSASWVKVSEQRPVGVTVSHELQQNEENGDAWEREGVLHCCLCCSSSCF